MLSALNEAITTSDASRLREQLADLDTMRTELRQLLAVAPDGTGTASAPT